MVTLSKATIFETDPAFFNANIMLNNSSRFRNESGSFLSGLE